MDQGAERFLLREQDGLSEVHHNAPPFAAAGGTIVTLRASRQAQAERATLSGMAFENFAETLLKGPDFDQNGPLRPNASQRSQVVDGHGPCVRNRRKSETVEKRPERIPSSPFFLRRFAVKPVTGICIAGWIAASLVSDAAVSQVDCCPEALGRQARASVAAACGDPLIRDSLRGHTAAGHSLLLADYQRCRSQQGLRRH